jgi:hypothetical protein
VLDIITWKWKPKEGYRSAYGPATVNTMLSMVDRHYRHPYRFSCVTDDPVGIDPAVRIIPLWDEHKDLTNPWGAWQPSCYRRLRMFAADAAEWIGPRFVSLDLDTVICDDMAPVWNRPEDFMMWGDTSNLNPYNGSMVMMTAGARRQVWDRFHPVHSPRESKRQRFFGSDQGWIATVLGPGERRWTTADGVYSFRVHILRNGGRLPPDARIVFFHGRHDPWQPAVQSAHAWVREHWR